MRKNITLFNVFFSLLPICNGGCPDRRLAAKDENDRVNLCDMLNHDNGRALEDFLYDYYLTLNR